MTENKRYEYWKDSDTAYDTKIQYGQYFRIIEKRDMVYLLNKQEETNMQLRNQIKIFELFLDSNNLNIEWDLFCTKKNECPFTDINCQECIYLGISGDVE